MTWRALAAAVVALWLLPVVLALALLWMPLLCCAVAAIRFRRVKRRMRGCCDDGDGGDGWRDEEVTVEDAGDRLRLLHQYLDDQMELVVGAAGEGGDDAQLDQAQH